MRLILSAFCLFALCLGGRLSAQILPFQMVVDLTKDPYNLDPSGEAIAQLLFSRPWTIIRVNG